VRCRVSVVNVYFRWLVRKGHVSANTADAVAGPDSPLRTRQRVYGKQQAPNPGRWLTRDEAFTTLIGACQDGTLRGLRDELVVRFGLLGMRAAEIGRLEVGNLHLDDRPPSVAWTAKRYKARRLALGRTLITGLDRDG
jgi:integrase